MNGLVVLIPIALLLGLAGLGAFFWSVKSGQFEDMDGAAMRVLIDDEAPVKPRDEPSDAGR
jgi:cbb3-type cytochrome oxidase maturation protein